MCQRAAKLSLYFTALIGFSSICVGQGLSNDETLSLTADLVLLRYENSIDNCEHMGAKNMEQLYDAQRQLAQLRQEVLPVKTTRFIERAKSSFRVGLAGLPKPEVYKPDHVALICERAYEKIHQMNATSFTQVVQSSVREYQMLFAQAK